MSSLQLSIDENYFKLVPRPDTAQINSLRNGIQEDGQQVSIIVNEKGIILDGHTRFTLCKELNLIPKYVIKKFTSLLKEKEFVVSANLNRRQMTLFERGEVLFAWWKEEKRIGRANGGYSAWTKRRTGKTTGVTVTGKKERLLQRFARIVGSSASVCHQLTWLLLHAPEDYKVKLRKEEITISMAYKLLAKPKLKPQKEYRDNNDYLQYPICLNCGARTISVKKTKCHVHNSLCCEKCGWGY